MQVYWPMDVKWYTGYVKGYDMETKIHHVWPFAYLSYYFNDWNSFKLKKLCASIVSVRLAILDLLIEISSFHK